MARDRAWNNIQDGEWEPNCCRITPESGNLKVVCDPSGGDAEAKKRDYMIRNRYMFDAVVEAEAPGTVMACLGEDDICIHTKGTVNSGTGVETLKTRGTILNGQHMFLLRGRPNSRFYIHEAWVHNLGIDLHTHEIEACNPAWVKIADLCGGENARLTYRQGFVTCPPLGYPVSSVDRDSVDIGPEGHDVPYPDNDGRTILLPDAKRSELCMLRKLHKSDGSVSSRASPIGRSFGNGQFIVEGMGGPGECTEVYLGINEDMNLNARMNFYGYFMVHVRKHGQR